MSEYLIPAQRTRAEIQVTNSRFIATLAPAFSVEEARAFISEVKAKFSDATHNVPVFIIGHGASIITHSGDDGEPSGTAGRPALAVLQGSGLGDVAVVVTRYFGGTKLGTGGLVRAYSDAVRAVLAITPRAAKVATRTIEVTCPYALYERLRLLIEHHSGLIRAEEFAAEVALRCEFPADGLPAFQAALDELSHGKLSAEVVASNPAAIMPLGGLRPTST